MRVSSLLERLKEAEEEVEEGPGEGPSSEPPSSRKAAGKIKRHGKESDEEGVSITTVRRPLKMTEIQGSRVYTASEQNPCHLVASLLGQQGQ